MSNKVSAVDRITCSTIVSSLILIHFSDRAERQPLSEAAEAHHKPVDVQQHHRSLCQLAATSARQLRRKSQTRAGRALHSRQAQLPQRGQHHQQGTPEERH